MDGLVDRWLDRFCKSLYFVCIQDTVGSLFPKSESVIYPLGVIPICGCVSVLQCCSALNLKAACIWRSRIQKSSQKDSPCFLEWANGLRLPHCLPFHLLYVDNCVFRCRRQNESKLNPSKSLTKMCVHITAASSGWGKNNHASYISSRTLKLVYNYYKSDVHSGVAQWLRG